MLTTDLDNTYESFNGTSEAAPLVAGALGLALSYGLDRNDIKDNVFPVRNANL
jgi:subtilase family serine protease